MIAAISDADNAELYDLLNPWDATRWPADRFYSDLVQSATDVLDVGCGTGAMLHQARAAGHKGRLVGIDPDAAALDRARRRHDVEWVEGRGSDIAWNAEFDLVVMVSHAFQCLVTDDEIRNSLTRIRDALRPGGRFGFEIRNPQARAWEQWNPSNASTLEFNSATIVSTHHIESVADGVVTFTETTTDSAGAALRVDRSTLRFLDVAPLNEFLADAGFEIEAQYGDWDRSPIDQQSREIITIATRLA